MNASFQATPTVRVIARQLRDTNCLAAIFVLRRQDVSSGPLGFFPVFQSEECQKPQPPLLLKKCRNTPPICVAICLHFVLQCFRCPYASRKGIYCQCSSPLYRSTPPISIAVCLPFVSQCFWKHLGGCGHRDVPHSEKPRIRLGYTVGSPSKSVFSLPQNPCPKKGQNGALSLP